MYCTTAQLADLASQIIGESHKFPNLLEYVLSKSSTATETIGIKESSKVVEVRRGGAFPYKRHPDPSTLGLNASTRLEWMTIDKYKGSGMHHLQWRGATQLEFKCDIYDTLTNHFSTYVSTYVGGSMFKGVGDFSSRWVVKNVSGVYVSKFRSVKERVY